MGCNARGRDGGARQELAAEVKDVDRPVGALDSERVDPFVDILGLFAAKCPQ